MPDEITAHTSHYQEARQEYMASVAAYVVERFAESKQDAVVHRYLEATERILAAPGQSISVQLQSVNFTDTDMVELADYMFRHVTDASGQTVQDRYLTEIAPGLREPVRRLAEIRRATRPGLWQVMDKATSAGAVTVANLFDGRRGRLEPDDAALSRRHTIVFGELGDIDDEYVPFGVIYVTSPGHRGWLMKAIERSFAQARVTGLVGDLPGFLTLYEPWIRGAIRVLNGNNPRQQAVSYLPALGRVDLGRQVAKQVKKSFKVPADFRMPEWGIQFGTPRAETPKVEVSHRYLIRDPKKWVGALAQTENFCIYRTDQAFGWWYYGDATPFASEKLQRSVLVHPILADIRLDNMEQIVIRVFSSRVFNRLEPVLRALAPQGQVLPKPVAEVTPLQDRLVIYQVEPKYLGYYVSAAESESPLTPEEQDLVDREWMVKVMLETVHRWSGGKTLPDLVAEGHRGAVEDFLDQICFLSPDSADSYQLLIEELRSRLGLADSPASP